MNVGVVSTGTGEALSLQVGPPHKFPTFLAHQVERWRKFHPDETP